MFPRAESTDLPGTQCSCCITLQVPQVPTCMLNTFSAVKCTCLLQRVLTVVGPPSLCQQQGRLACQLTH